MMNKILATIALSAGILLCSSGSLCVYAGPTSLFNVGAARGTDGIGVIDLAEGAGLHDEKMDATEGLISAGAAGAEEATEALRIINAIASGGISEETLDQAHELALATVEGRELVEEEGESDGVICGYRNVGIAKVDNWLNVREKPAEDAELVGKMPKNAGCEILEIDNGWAHIKSARVDGYASLEYLYTGEDARQKALSVMMLMATINTTTLFVREEPSTESSVITMIPMGEELEVLEELDEWCKIAIDDEEGFISKEYVALETKLDHAVTMKELRAGMGYSETRVNMINYAKQFLGNPYVWGGTSLTKGTDCSGFTMGIYRKFGVSLPRVSRAQATVGTKVTVAELLPGDLVFYGKGSYINHVAMYIGGGQVIHASSRKTGIKISNVGYRTPITCRRILSN